MSTKSNAVVKMYMHMMWAILYHIPFCHVEIIKDEECFREQAQHKWKA
jgi:hypothetical protein